jgi:hypothetical protein
MRVFGLLAIVVLTSGLVSSATAQTDVASLVGTVRDSAGVPAPGVQFIVGKLLWTNSDSAGRFALAKVEPGRYPIRVLALGFYEMSFPAVDFQAGDTVRLNFLLVPKPSRNTECMTVEGCRQAR